MARTNLIHNRIATWLVLALMLACVGALPAIASLQGAKLVILGSSTAAGTGASQASKSWVGQLSAWLALNKNMDVKNLAVPGALTGSALCASEARTLGKAAPSPQNADKALALGATHMLLAFPSNDATAGMSAAQTVANILSIRRCAEASGAKVAVLSSQPRAGLTQAQRDTIAEVDAQLKQKFGRCHIEVHALLAEPGKTEPAPTLSAGDGVHFNDRGHAVIYSAVRRFLEGGECF